MRKRPSSRVLPIFHLTAATGRHAIGRDSIIKTSVLKQLSTTPRQNQRGHLRRGTRATRNCRGRQLPPQVFVTGRVRNSQTQTGGHHRLDCSSGRREQPQDSAPKPRCLMRHTDSGEHSE